MDFIRICWQAGSGLALSITGVLTAQQWHGYPILTSQSGESARAWAADVCLLQGTTYPFRENKGQIYGGQTGFVFCTFGGAGMQAYLTSRGMSCFFYQGSGQHLEEETHGRERCAQTEGPLIEWERIEVELVGAEIAASQVEFQGSSPDYENYYLAHCPEGILGVRRYRMVRVREVWPGIDWVLRYGERGIEQEFILRPGARVEQVRLRIKSLWPVEVSESFLRVRTRFGEIREQGLRAYAGEEQRRMAYVRGQSYVIGGIHHQEIGFAVEGFRGPVASLLVLDPVLEWATYFGGSEADDYTPGPGTPAVAVLGAAGNERAILVGATGSADLSVQSFGNAVFQGSLRGRRDAFIALFDARGARLWTTYYGGTDIDEAAAVAATGDATQGRIYVVGATRSPDFPTRSLPGAHYQGALAGGLGFDAFILRLNQEGVCDWATFYGGSSEDKALSIAVAGSTSGTERVYVVGRTGSADFPRQNAPGAYFQTTYGGGIDDAFILRFNASGAREWATFYGGADMEWALDVATAGAPPEERIYMVGFTRSPNFPLRNLASAYNQSSYGGGEADAFIVRFGPDGSQQWATYYGGGSGATGRDDAYGVAAIRSASTERVYVVGRTEASDFPLLPRQNAYNQTTFSGTSGNAFILKFDEDGNRIWATLLGGDDEDVAHAVSLAGPAGRENVYITGRTRSANFPLKDLSGSYYQSTLGGVRDVFISLFDSSGAQVWTSYYGGDGDDVGRRLAIASSPSGVRIYLVGNTSSANLSPQGPSGAYTQSYGSSGDALLLRFAGPATANSVPIESVSERWLLTGTAGMLSIKTEVAGAFEVLDLLGRLVTRVSLTAGETCILLLGRGCYIVRHQETATIKRVVVL